MRYGRPCQNLVTRDEYDALEADPPSDFDSDPEYPGGMVFACTFRRRDKDKESEKQWEQYDTAVPWQSVESTTH